MKCCFLLALIFSAARGQTVDIRVDVSLVRVPATVTDRKGNFVNGLHQQDFQLLDNGRAREIQYLWQEADLPLTVGLIADVSGSQSSFIDRHRSEVSQFLEQVLGPKDQAFLVAVAANPWLVTDLTGSLPELRKGVDRIGRARTGPILGEPCPPKLVHGRHPLAGCGGTALWNAVYAAARLKIRTITGRKALIVFSDGVDTGSTHSLSDAIEAAQSAETIVYTLHSYNLAMAMFPAAAVLTAEGNRHLTTLAEETGGKPFPSPRNGPVEIFAQIEGELRNLYVIGFTAPADVGEGTFHKLELKATQKGITVRGRKGYSVGQVSDPPNPH